MSDTRYDAVNDGAVFPAITREEAKAAFAKLVRAFGKPADAALVTNVRDIDGPGVEKRPLWETGSPTWWTNGHGYRRVWVSPKPRGGHWKGWGRLIHDVSHMVHRYRNPKAKPHEGDHHRLELEVLTYVRDAGWLGGSLKPAAAVKPSRADRRDDRHERLTARLAKWESKHRRAETAIKKLKRQLRAMERRNLTPNTLSNPAASTSPQGATQ